MQYVIIGIVAVVAVALTAARKRTGMGLTWLAGMALIYVAQRMFADDVGELPGTIAGLAVVVLALGLRARAMGTTTDVQQAATQRTSLMWQLLGTGAVLVWFLTTPTVTDALGYAGEALDRWTVSWTALWPIVFLAGAVPMILVDTVLEAHPREMPEGARKQAVAAGLALAFGTALIFPVNYLANAHDVDWNFSYFRVTAPGTSTLALVRNMDEPIEALLFYPPSSDTKEEMVPYWKELAAASDGKLTVRVLDQPSVPDLAKELTVRDNGYVVLRQGESATQKFKIDADLDRARRDLRKLDGTVQKHLLKLVRDKRIAYLTTGHGEASPRDTNPFFKLGDLKQLLISQNYDVKDLGLEQGSAEGIPADAALVVVAAPEKAMLSEEIAVLQRYVDGGGALMVYADAGRDSMTDLLGHLGLSVTKAPVMDAAKYVRITGGIADRMNVYSQRFGSHAATSTLSKYATRAPLVLPSVVAITETGAGKLPDQPKYVPLVRSYEDAWIDDNGNFQRDGAEVAGVQVLATSIEGPESNPYRVIVVGDVSVAADVIVEQMQGNAVFALDSVRWLVGDEELSGEVSSEEDVKIEHTREQDQAWFYGTIFGFPLLVLVAGAFFVRRRTSRG